MWHWRLAHAFAAASRFLENPKRRLCGELQGRGADATMSFAPMTRNVGAGHGVFESAAAAAETCSRCGVQRVKARGLSGGFYRSVIEGLEPRRLMAAVPGTGLTATYYDNFDFTGATVTRLEKKIFADYGVASPAPDIAPTTYSVRWTGKIKPSYSETYTFHTTADDGVRLWVNHRLVIDDWHTHKPLERSGTVTLEANKRVDIQLEYFNKRGAGSVQLWWSSPSQPKSVVPQSRLYPQAAEPRVEDRSRVRVRRAADRADAARARATT